jgi:putative RNA 2'-phosphotransferase
VFHRNASFPGNRYGIEQVRGENNKLPWAGQYNPYEFQQITMRFPSAKIAGTVPNRLKVRSDCCNLPTMQRILFFRHDPDASRSCMDQGPTVHSMPKSTHEVEKFSKFLAYVLGHRPDEFGLVPDNEGFVRIKELLQALHEEPGWRHIRDMHLHEVVSTLLQPPVEIVDGQIRALERSNLPEISPLQSPAKLLYVATRSRAYPVVSEKGLAVTHRPYLVLSNDIEMAMRMGRRVDHNPVLLTVQVIVAVEKGTHFRQYGQHLFLADKIFVGSFSGPAMTKPKPQSSAPSPPVKTAQPKMPGSYFPDPDAFQTHKHRQAPNDRHKEPDWKKARRHARKYKEHQNR